MRRVPAFLFLYVVCQAATFFANTCLSDDAAQIAFFEQKIRSVLVEHCYECHIEQADKLKGGLLLDSKAGWSIGGDSGETVIVPGDPAASFLIQYLHDQDGLEIPTAGKLRTKTACQVATTTPMLSPPG